MTQVQLRLPTNLVAQIDKWVRQGRFKNRSEAIRSILFYYEEREKTRAFYERVAALDREMEEHPERMVPLEKIWPGK